MTALTEFGQPSGFKILADFNILTALQYRLEVASAVLATFWSLFGFLRR